MKYFIILFLAVAISTLSACASNRYHQNGINIHIVKQPQQKWIFKNVMLHTSSKSSFVSGRLTSTTRFGLPHGHIDIAAYSPSGELIAETTTAYSPSILTRKAKRRGGCRFSAEIKRALPKNSVIKVAFHREAWADKEKPAHKYTIAK